MPRIKEMAGLRFGKLLVTGRSDRKDLKGSYYWVVQCDCGKTYETLGTRLRSGRASSCGCSNNHPGVLDGYHGYKKSDRLYRIWTAMRRRCHSPTAHNFQWYGGKGVEVTSAWRFSFPNFLQWAIPAGYSDDLSIDRIDATGNYEPSNCRWADSKTQAINKRPRALPLAA